MIALLLLYSSFFEACGLPDHGPLSPWKRCSGNHHPGNGGPAPNPNQGLFDFSAATPPSFIHYTRSGGDVYVGNGAGVVTAVGADTAVYEDLGDGRGKGLWTWHDFTNLPNDGAFDFSSSAGASDDWTGWTQSNLNKQFAYDSSSTKSYALKTAGATITVGASPAGGAFGNALTFNAATRAPLQVPEPVAAITGNYALELHVKMASDTGFQGLVGRHDDGRGTGNNVWLYAQHEGTDVMSFWCGYRDSTGAASYVHSSNITPVVNTDHVIACDYNGTTQRIFVDGNLESSAANANGVRGDNQGPFAIGDWGTDSSLAACNCTIDEVRLSNVSRHSATYTPSASPFTSDANTVLLFHAEQLQDAYVSGVTGPDSSSNAATFYGVGGKISGAATAATTGAAVASAWVKGVTLSPQVPGDLNAQQATTSHACGVSFGSSSTWHRVTTTLFKGSSVTSKWVLYPAGATIGTPTGPGTCATTTIDATQGGGVSAWGAQVLETDNAAQEVPLVDGSTGHTVVSLDSSYLSSVLHDDALYVSGSYLMDPIGIENGGDLFQFVNGDGVTELRFVNVGITEMNMWVNDVDFGAVGTMGNPTQAYYGIPADVWWGMYVNPTSGHVGFRVKYNGCMVGGSDYTHDVPVAMNAPTSFYFGSDGTTDSSFLSHRHRSLSFRQFTPDAGEGIIIGDSILSAYSSTHTAVCSWIYTLAESRSRPGIVSGAFVGATIGGQMSTFDNYYNASDRSWIIVMVGINDLDTCETPGTDCVVATTASLQTFVDDIRGKLPLATILLEPVAPCNGGCTSWADAAAYNANIAGTGDNPITCTGSCYRGATWDTTLLLGDGSNTGTMSATVDSGDHLHPNETGGHRIGDRFRADLVANGKL